MTIEGASTRPPLTRGHGRGRPRQPDVDAAIIAACLSVLAEVGYARCTMAEIARRAGVGKPTLYRRWAQKSQLVVDAMVTRMPPAVGSGTGEIGEKLLEYTTRLSETLTHTPLGRVLPGLVAEMATDPELADRYRTLVVEPTRQLWRDAVESGIQSGELRPDTDVDFVLDALAGPLYVRLLITGAPADPDAPGRAVKLVLARYGASPGDGPTGRNEAVTGGSAS